MGAAKPSECQLLKYCVVPELMLMEMEEKPYPWLKTLIVCLILSYGDLSIETVFGETGLLTAAENQRWGTCRLLYELQAVLTLRALSRGSSLYSSLSCDHHACLVKCSRNVRDLSHVCWCVIRKKPRRCIKIISERSYQLPLSTH